MSIETYHKSTVIIKLILFITRTLGFLVYTLNARNVYEYVNVEVITPICIPIVEQTG